MNETSGKAAANERRACRVLLVEDYDVLAQLRARGLRRLGLIVQTAPDAECGLRYLARNGADVVVADLGLPGIDGVALLKEAAEWYPRIGRVLISGQLTDEAREWADSQTPKVPVVLKGEDPPDVLLRWILRECRHHVP
jgi:CheY-like chemotaxis protein